MVTGSDDMYNYWNCITCASLLLLYIMCHSGLCGDKNASYRVNKMNDD